MLRWVEHAKKLKLQQERSQSANNETQKKKNVNLIKEKDNCTVTFSSEMPSKQDVLKLHLLKERDHGLGIQISGGCDAKGASKGIYISHLLDEGVANRDGRLVVGDEILFINGFSFIAKTLNEATELLQCAKNPVQLVISRQMKDGLFTDDLKKRGTDPSYLNNSSFVLDNNNNNNAVKQNMQEKGISDNNLVGRRRAKNYTKEIILINGKDGKKLGFSITGGVDDKKDTNISIKNILPGGVIGQDGRLKPGDIILKVNDIPLSGFTYHEAISLFKSLKKGPVKFLVQSKRQQAKISSSQLNIGKQHVPNQIDVEIMKSPTKGLGIGFGHSSKNGLFIKYIAKGTLSAVNGKLQLKDYIISLNGISVKDTQLEDFHKIIRNLQPGIVRLTVQRLEDKNNSNVQCSSSLSYSSSELSSLSSGDQARRNSNTNLASLMSPAMPVHNKHGTPSTHKQSNTITLGDSDYSDDDFQAVSAFSPHSKSKSFSKTDNKRQNKDGWLHRESLGERPTVTSYKPEDMVIDLHGDNGRTTEIGSSSNETREGYDVVTIQRDKSGSLGLSIKMKRSSTTVGNHEGVFAKNVTPHGSADKASGSNYGGVRSGDRIMKVNDISLDDLTYDDVIAYFKRIPKRSKFTLQRGSSANSNAVSSANNIQRRQSKQQQVHDDMSNKQIAKTMRDKKHNSLDMPNMIEESIPSKELVIKRSSMLNSSVRSKSSSSKSPTTSHSSLSSSRNPTRSGSVSSSDSAGKKRSPLKTMLSITADHHHHNNDVTRAASFKVVGKEEGIGVPLPEPSEIPTEMNVHLIEISKEDDEGLGISLVPSTGKCTGFFQVRRIQPESASEQSGNIFKDDCIYSVNGVSLKGISHPQALQILKQCGKNAKIVLFRCKQKDLELLNKTSAHTSPNVSKKYENGSPSVSKKYIESSPKVFRRFGNESPNNSSNSNAHFKNISPRDTSLSTSRNSKMLSSSSSSVLINPLPGTIAAEIMTNVKVRPTFQRRTTDSSMASIPTLHSDNSKEKSPISQRKEEKSNRNSTSKTQENSTKSQNASSKLSENNHQTVYGLQNISPRVYSSSNSQLSTPSRCDGDDEYESCDNTSNPHTPRMLPKCHTVNRRSNVGAFSIDCEKTFKGLGIDIMIDEEGECYITDILPNGILANDERIRVGDNLIAVNNDCVQGKPISVVRNIIRSVPRGTVRLILKATNENETATHFSTNDDRESVFSSSTYFEDQHSTTALSTYTLPLPNDEKSRVPAKRQSSLNKNSKSAQPHLSEKLITRLPISFTTNESVSYEDVRSQDKNNKYPREVLDDNESECTFMPPAPPRPSVPSELGGSYGDYYDEEDCSDDDGSAFSSMPAPPPPVLNFREASGTIDHKKNNRPFGGVQLPITSDLSIPQRMQKGDTSSEFSSSHFLGKDTSHYEIIDCDDGKSDFYIPPPPPPVSAQIRQRFDSHHTPEETTQDNNINDELMRMNREYKTNERRQSLDLTEKFVQQSVENTSTAGTQHASSLSSDSASIGTTTSSVKKRRNSKTRSNSMSKSEQESAIVNTQQVNYSNCPDQNQSEVTEIYYPPNSPFHLRNQNKKKSLFSRLKSKLLLPSKNDMSSKSEKRKGEQYHQQQKLYSDISDKAPKSGNMKASLSHPDIIVACEQDVIDGGRVQLKKTGSLDEKSFLRELISDSGSYQSSPSLNVKALPRILSFRRPSHGDKKKKRKISTRNNVSPPSTPPPPPPCVGVKSSSESVPEQKPHIVISSNEYMEEENPYESLDDLEIPFDERDNYDDAVFSDDSGGPGLYAAEGPSIFKDTDENLIESQNNVVDSEMKRRLSPNIKKPPPPPPKPLLDTIIHSELKSSLRQRTHSLTVMNVAPNIAEGPTEEQNTLKGKPGIKKRGSSLLSLQFPPPPVENYEEEKNSPLATSSVESSFEISDQSLSGVNSSVGFEARNQQDTQLYSQVTQEIKANPQLSEENPYSEIVIREPDIKKFHTRLSEQDKSDPKLQPFVVSDEILGSLRDVNGNLIDNSEDENDDWGSEFSTANTIDDINEVETNKSKSDTKSKQNYSRYASPHRTDMFTVSTAPASPTPEEKSPPKLKIQFKKNPFKRSTSQSGQALKEKKTAPCKNEKRKQVKSMPPNFYGKDLKISSPVLVRRSTASQIFSEKEIMHVIGSPTTNSSLDTIVNDTILRNNLKNTAITRTTSVSERPVMTSQEYAVPIVPQVKQATFTNETATNQVYNGNATNATDHLGIKNPIPKPPRRMSHSHFLESEDNYENFNQLNTQESSTFVHDVPSVETDVNFYRPLPEIPFDEDEFRLNNTTLDEDEINALYAKVDIAKKNASKENPNTHKKSQQSIKMQGPSNQGPYLLQEKTNKSIKKPQALPMPFKTIPVDDPLAASPLRKASSTSLNMQKYNVDDGYFKVEMLREAGKSLGLAIVGGSDTVIDKILIREVEKNSVAAACDIQLWPGDEVVKINNQSVAGCVHQQALELLKNSPPLMVLTMRREEDCNEALLKKERKASGKQNIPGQIDTAAFLESIRDSSKHTKESELVLIKEQQMEQNIRPVPPKPNLSIGSFDVAEEKLNRLMKTPKTAVSSNNNLNNNSNNIKSPSFRKRTQSIPSLNTNVFMTSPNRTMTPSSIPVKQANWLEIDLYKQPGRGLGIAVSGGPKHVIEDGIKVKRLVPESIAGMDGRLHANDLICTINGRQLKGMTQGDALTFLKDIPKVINLGVRRSVETATEDVFFADSPSSSSYPTVISSERKSRSRSKDSPPRRARSETREDSREKSQYKQRPRSVSRLSRFFGGSRDNINELGKDSIDGTLQSKKQTQSKRKKNKRTPQLFTICFDKTSTDAFDFTLAGGMNTMYGDSSIVVESVRKGSEISKSLKVHDELVSIQGVDVSNYSRNEAWDYLLVLPIGRVCMVIQRKER